MEIASKKCQKQPKWTFSGCFLHPITLSHKDCQVINVVHNNAKIAKIAILAKMPILTKLHKMHLKGPQNFKNSQKQPKMAKMTKRTCPRCSLHVLSRYQKQSLGLKTYNVSKKNELPTCQLVIFPKNSHFGQNIHFGKIFKSF